MRVLFFGTPPFAAEILRFLVEKGVEVLAVVTRPDKPKGRSNTPLPSAVKEYASAQGLPIHQPTSCSAPESADTLASYRADLFVVVAYGEILKENILALPLRGCVNVHASLLPHYRGAAPIQRCLMAGEKETGVSIMYMVRKMDAGDVIQMVHMPIPPDMTAGELEKALCHLGAEALWQVISAMDQGPVSATSQDHALATFAPKVELEDVQIDWAKSAQVVHNLVRGANPAPGAWCWVAMRGKRCRLKILRTALVEGRGAPGSILETGPTELVVGCGQGALRLLELQLEGKRPMAVSDWLRGTPHSALTFL